MTTAHWKPDAVADYLRETGRFDAAWYAATMGLESEASEEEALEHFLSRGAVQGRGPNPKLDMRESPFPAAEDEGVVESNLISSRTALARLASSAGVFDAPAYLEAYPDVQAAGLDPLLHFLEYGWKELRNPSADFDVWWYWSNYLDSTSEAVDPLEHYLLVGAACGHECLPPVSREWATGNQLHPDARRICLFAGYDLDGLVDDYVVRYMRELSRHADIYYLADCAMQSGQLDRLAPYTKGAWAFRHGEYDFGSWSRLARELVGWDRIEQYDELLFANDSCYLLRELDGVFAKMDATPCDWWGMQLTKRNFTEESLRSEAAPNVEAAIQGLYGQKELHTLDQLHISSYFLAFRKPVITDEGFRARLDSVVAQDRKFNTIMKYEIGLSRYLFSMGFRAETYEDVLHPFHPLYTSRIFELISAGFPFFKRLLLTDNTRNVPSLSNWKERLLELVPDADVEEMERNLLRVADDDKLQRSFRVEVGKDGIARPPAMLNSAEFKAADIETPTFDHWWAFPVCAFDSTLGGNERALFEEVKNDPSLKKIVLTRKRRVELDGENVVVVPLDSPEGQYHLLRSGQVFVKHSPSINAKWPLSPKLHNFINLWHGIPLKRFGPASLGLADKDLAAIKRENLLCRAVVSSSKVDALAMASAFYPLRYQDVWITGLPRNDFIVRDEHLLPDDFRQELSRLDEDLGGRRLVLYAPTFRSDQEAGSYQFSEQELAWLREWLERTGSVLGVREHMADIGQSYARQLSGLGVLDLSSKRYPNIEVLYRRSSLLVTDYSSCAVDFMLTGRPVLSFAYDLEEYENEERGLFYDLDHVFPGPVCRSLEELMLALDGVLAAEGEAPDGEYEWKRKFFFEHQDDTSSSRLVSKVKALYLDGCRGMDNQRKGGIQ